VTVVTETQPDTSQPDTSPAWLAVILMSVVTIGALYVFYLLI